MSISALQVCAAELMQRAGKRQRWGLPRCKRPLKGRAFCFLLLPPPHPLKLRNVGSRETMLKLSVRRSSS